MNKTNGDKDFNEILNDFNNLDVTDTKECDKFFENYGCGNTLNIADSPWERYFNYSTLLEEIATTDKAKFAEMHKGIPYYFLSWLAWDMRNFDKALFYMDAAVSEDKRRDAKNHKNEINAPSNGLNDPAGKFLLLEATSYQAAKRCMDELIQTVKKELKRFEEDSKKSLQIESFIEYFVKPFLEQSDNRPVVSAFYIFLMEREERLFELKHRSSSGGTITTILASLFKGALIWETLLKIIYPTQDNGNPVKTIGNAVNTRNFKKDFNLNLRTSANDLKEVIMTANSYRHSIKTAFDTTAKLRNTAGHKITWNDVFNNEQNFIILHEHISDAILYLIQKKYIEGKSPLSQNDTSKVCQIKNDYFENNKDRPEAKHTESKDDNKVSKKDTFKN